MEPKEITVGKMKCVLHPLPVLKAIHLDRKVVSMLLPMVGGFESLDSEISFASMFDALGKSIGGMNEREYTAFVLDLLCTTQCVVEGQAPVQISSEADLDIFRGATMNLYKLMFEVMRYNKFAPFELVGGGDVMAKMLIFLDQKKSGAKSGTSSAQSVS